MHPSYIIYHIPVIQSAAHLIKQTSNHLNLPFLRADFYEATKDKQLGHLSIMSALTLNCQVLQCPKTSKFQSDIVIQLQPTLNWLTSSG